MSRTLWRLVSKEPVLLGALVLAVAQEYDLLPEAVALALVAWGVRMVTTPAERARQREAEAANTGHVEGYHAALDAVTELDPKKLNPEPARARKR